MWQPEHLWPVCFGLLTITLSQLTPADGKALLTCPTGQTLKTVNLTKVCTDCTACGPGEEALLSCRPDLDTVCSPCPDGTFSHVTSSSHRCQVCTSRLCFSPNPFLKLSQRNCTAKRDTSCDECGEGKYKSKETQNCEPCDICQPNEEEVQACTYQTKRICVLTRTQPTTPPQGSTGLILPSLVPTIKSTSPTQIDQQSKGHGSATEDPDHERTAIGSLTQETGATRTKSPAKAHGESQRTVIGVTTTITLIAIILSAAIITYYYRKHKSCRQQNDCSEEEPPERKETTPGAQEDRDEVHKTSVTPETGVPQSQDPETDRFLPEEAVHRLSILQRTPAAFRNRMCLLLSHPDSNNGKDWRSLLPVLDLSSDEDFKPWLSDSAANSTEPVETLLGKVSGKTVEEFDASLSKAELKDAVDYIWKAQTFETTEGNPLPATATQASPDSF